jgi:5'-3' exonuclease
MIILDYSAIAMAAFFARGSSAEESMLRHFILNSVRLHNVNHRDKYGKMVIACDSRSWRKDAYPQYKANRKTGRDKSEVDWDSVFQTFTKVKEELKENFPYTVVTADGAEADDIIATLVKETQEFGKNEPVMIISSDKDFVQLHRYGNVKQYSPITKKFVTHEKPVEYLYEHIFKGDSSDGVPNVLSDDDTFVDMDKRQRPLSKKKIALWIDNINDLESVMTYDELRNYQRNKKVIDLNEIPDEVTNNIKQEVENSQPSKLAGSKVLNYLIQNRLNSLVESVQEFL